MKLEVKEGTILYDIRYGKLTVIEIKLGGTKYLIVTEDELGKIHTYTREGREKITDDVPLLSLVPYTLWDGHFTQLNQELPFKKGDWVLVRDYLSDTWVIDIFNYYDQLSDSFSYECNHEAYNYCIPFKGNEELLGTLKPQHLNDYD